MRLEDVSVENVCRKGKFEFVASRADESDRLALRIDRIFWRVDDVDTFDPRKQLGHFFFHRKILAAAHRFSEKFLLLEDLDLQTFLRQMEGRRETAGTSAYNDYVVFATGQVNRSAARFYLD